MSNISFGYLACNETPSGTGESHAALWDEIVAEAEQLESSDFDSFYLTEHHQQETGYWPSLLVPLAGVAAHTETLELGTHIQILPLYHPSYVAEAGTLLDIISDGRFTLGVGVGDSPEDFETRNIEFYPERISRFEEALQVLPRLWTETDVKHFGKNFELNGVTITPTTVQEPRPPIHLAGWSHVGAERAARLGDGITLDPLHSVTALSRIIETYEEACERYGKDGYISMSRESWIHDGTEGDAESRWKQEVMHPHRFYFDINAYNGNIEPEIYERYDSPEDLNFDSMQEGRFVYGSPDECVAEIEKYLELGVDEVILRMRYAEAPSHEATMDAIERFGDEVIPHFRAQ